MSKAPHKQEPVQPAKIKQILIKEKGVTPLLLIKR